MPHCPVNFNARLTSHIQWQSLKTPSAYCSMSWPGKKVKEHYIMARTHPLSDTLAVGPGHETETDHTKVYS